MKNKIISLSLYDRLEGCRQSASNSLPDHEIWTCISSCICVDNKSKTNELILTRFKSGRSFDLSKVENVFSNNYKKNPISCQTVLWPVTHVVFQCKYIYVKRVIFWWATGFFSFRILAEHVLHPVLLSTQLSPAAALWNHGNGTLNPGNLTDQHGSVK